RGATSSARPWSGSAGASRRARAPCSSWPRRLTSRSSPPDRARGAARCGRARGVAVAGRRMSAPFDGGLTGEVDGTLGQDAAVSPQAGDEERVVESALRPHSLTAFIGQPKGYPQLGPLVG